MAESDKKLVAVARLDDIAEGAIFAINIDDTPIGLTRVDGVLHAFGDICTHDDGPLAEGEIDSGCVVCPRHGARFDLKTGKPTFPAVTKIPIYKAVVDGDQVKIEI
jgi:3-phenylpropionate/trans-cinnamate dioxygenase ferredoxin subunit